MTVLPCKSACALHEQLRLDGPRGQVEGHGQLRLDGERGQEQGRVAVEPELGQPPEVHVRPSVGRLSKQRVSAVVERRTGEE